jgi:hypothetical protein
LVLFLEVAACEFLGIRAKVARIVPHGFDHLREITSSRFCARYECRALQPMYATWRWKLDLLTALMSLACLLNGRLSASLPDGELRHLAESGKIWARDQLEKARSGARRKVIERGDPGRMMEQRGSVPSGLSG